MDERIIRVFPRKTNYSPTDNLAFFGPPGFHIPKEDLPVKVSVTFTWDKQRGESLAERWSKIYSDVSLGGPAFDDPGLNFVPGMFVKHGVTFTSRGCMRKCSFCMVTPREGKLKEFDEIVPGNVIGDNNFLACSRTHIEKVFAMLSTQKYGAEFSGGLDARLLKKWHVDLFKQIKIYSLWFACDSENGMKSIKRIQPMLTDFSFRKKRCYILMGFEGDSPIKAHQRATKIYDLGFLPFAQYYQPKNTKKKLKPRGDWLKVVWYWSRPAAFAMGNIPDQIKDIRKK